jgi:hypothetical protein
MNHAAIFLRHFLSGFCGDPIRIGGLEYLTFFCLVSRNRDSASHRAKSGGFEFDCYSGGGGALRPLTIVIVSGVCLIKAVNRVLN